MVQVLPYVPSNAERIAPAVGQGIINAIEGYKSAREKSNDEKILKQLENPDLTPAQRISAIASLSEKKQKGVGILYKDLLETQEKEKTHQEHLKTFAQKYGILPDQQQPQQQAQPNLLQAPVQQSTNAQQTPNIPPQQAVQQPVQQGVIPPNANAISPQAENIQPQRGFNPKDPQSWSDEEIVNLAEYSHSPYPELKGMADVAKQEAERRKLVKEQDRADKRLKDTLKAAEDRLDKNLSSQRERDIFSKNEPVLVEMGKELHSLHNQAADYARLEKLFETGKFPNANLASFFTEDGQLNDKAYALLEPEAQEALKIIVNSLGAAQKTFGGKVSNFEAATFLRGQPGLLNSPEAKKNILHNLKEVNKFNTDYIKGVLEVVDKKGGASKIPLSKVLEIYNKENEGKIEKHKEEFAKGREKTTFKSLPDPKNYAEGRFIRHIENGDLYTIKNGKWTKFEEPKE